MSELILNKTASLPSAVAGGKSSITVNNNNELVLTDEFESHVIGGVFGSEFQDEFEDTTQVNGSTTFETYISLSQILSTPGARYRIGFTCKWNMNADDRNIIIKVMKNGVEIDYFEVESKDKGNDIRDDYSSFFYFTDLTATNNTIEIQFAPENASKVASIYKGAIELWRVA